MPTRRRHDRAAWGTLSRDQVIDAAEQRVRAGEHETLSMRSLAAELGVAPMSLYSHVRDKDDLLDEVVDRLLANAWQPSVAREDWVDWIREGAERLRQLLITEPVALQTYLSHPVTLPNAIARMEAMLDVLRTAGFSPTEAEGAYAAVHTYTIGFAALEASRAANLGGSSDSADDPLRKRLARFTTAAQFRKGLTYLLEGLDGHRRNNDEAR
jgi:AcrR family transcriptional regulator